jgi:hypothetical protein
MRLEGHLWGPSRIVVHQTGWKGKFSQTQIVTECAKSQVVWTGPERQRETKRQKEQDKSRHGERVTEGKKETEIRTSSLDTHGDSEREREREREREGDILRHSETEERARNRSGG